MNTDLTDLASADDWAALLTATERRLVEYAARGQSLDLRSAETAGAAPGDPDRIVRGRVLSILLLGERDDWKLHHRGVRMAGAYITGAVDLDFGTVAVPMLLGDCVFEQSVLMRQASLQMLALPGTCLPGLSADRLAVTGSVLLHRGFAATGPVRMHNSRIGGSLDCDGGSFTHAEGYALSADRAEIAGHVLLRNGFTATGEVRFLGARIGGNLECAGGRCTNPGGHALIADTVDVGGSVMLHRGFVAKGEVNLVGARIGGNLECAGGSFIEPGGHALAADGVTVSDVFLRDGFASVGQVRIAGASLRGQLACNGASFTSADGYALIADEMEVNRSWWLRGAIFRKGALSAMGASVGVLFDDVEAWPQGWYGDGFSYSDFGGDASALVSDRLAWLHRQAGGFRPGPYSQLAAVYRRRGTPASAREVLVAREKRRTAALHWWRRPLRLLWGAASAYGYRPWRAIGVLGVLILLAGIVFADTPMTTLTDAGKHVTFIPWLYAAGLAIPLVDLRQAEDFQPQALWAQWFMWATIAAGWILSLAFAAAVTGIFRPDD